MSGRHTVYAIWEGPRPGEGELLYVGVTKNFAERMRVHRLLTSWLTDRHAVEEVATCTSQKWAMRAEAALIAAWQPKHNIRCRTVAA